MGYKSLDNYQVTACLKPNCKNRVSDSKGRCVNSSCIGSDKYEEAARTNEN